MRRALVAGNWKMNGTRASLAALVEGIKGGIDRAGNADVIVCPPYVFLSDVISMLSDTSVAVGAQDVSTNAPGAFTGDIAIEMLKDIGCTAVIVGHSERRAYHNESDAVVAEKFIKAQQAGLMPIVCVGETLEERERGETDKVVGRQLDALFAVDGGIGALSAAVIAYEPVWAIGTGKTATPDQAQAVHAFIRGRIGQRDAALADRLRILYGGSVKPANAAELFAMPDIDGGLIGGASLDANDFLAICAAVK